MGHDDQEGDTLDVSYLYLWDLCFASALTNSSTFVTCRYGAFFREDVKGTAKKIKFD